MLSEKEILDYWKKNQIFEKSLDKKGGEFIFYEGPPSANGKPGIHHVLARVYKDVIVRYQTMRGKSVVRKAGWDTHGLPVEIAAEKQFGISGKKAIENIVQGDIRASIEKFNLVCKEIAWSHKKEFEDITQRIGFWLDLENAYITYENKYIDQLWKVIKQIWDKDLLYKSYRTVPYCPRCETALSSHELAQGYKDANDPSVYILFKDTKVDEFYLVWTTTPWTLPANLAIAVSEKAEYGLYNVDGKKIWLAKNLANKIVQDEESLVSKTGEELVGQSYIPLYKSNLTSDNIYKIYTADFVSTDDGTGFVHIAPGFGEDDFNFGRANDLPVLVTIDQRGNMNSDLPGEGKFVKEADKDIMKDLSQRDLVFKSDRIVHTYPFCWRCATPVLYVARDSWFIKMSKLRDELVRENEKINWVPDHFKKGRFGSWLEEIKDWSLSRERYWGTPLPIWICQSCDHKLCIGSSEELNNLSDKKLDDLHRPYIDDIIMNCEKCNGEMKREPYVMDVWFDSGAMPFAALEVKDNRYPADFISEAIDQTRGWFYTLLAVGVLMGKGTPYKNVICLGHILDAKGQKMSKSKGNVIDPWEVIENNSADSLRLHLFSINQAGESKRFDLKDMATTHRKTIGILNNVVNFIQTYAEMDGINLKTLDLENPSGKLLDRWLIARTDELTNEILKNLDAYEVTRPSRAIIDYINDLSTWYLRRSRKDRTPEFYQTIVGSLKHMVISIAPFMPFVAEEIYQEFKNDKDRESVHLNEIQSVGKIDLQVLERMSSLRLIIQEGLKLRAKEGIKVRQPLTKITIDQELPEEEKLLIADELNVNSVEYGTGSHVLDTKLTPELIEEGKVRDMIRLVQEARKKAGYGYSEKVKTQINTDLQIDKFRARIEAETLTTLVDQLDKEDATAKDDETSVAVSR